MREAEVVICTRNRASLLPAACEAILAQDYPAERWGLLIVDNASTDGTFAVAQALEKRFEGRVRAVHEPETGHSAARNAGIRNTSARIIAFTDDDVLPGPSWLRTLVEVMDQEDALAAGGPVEPLMSGELPPWFLPQYLLYLAIWRPAEHVVMTLTYNDYPRGANLAFRREAFEQVGEFSRDLGLRGDRQRYCEETELCLRIERIGGRIVYTPHSVVRHHVDAERLSIDWLARRFAAQGRSEAILNWMHGGVRGLVRGSKVHCYNVRGVNWRSLASELGERDESQWREAARILTHCRRLALRGYLRQAPIAMATVPRCRPLRNTQTWQHWEPL